MTKPRKDFEETGSTLDRLCEMIVKAPDSFGLVVFFTPTATKAEVARLIKKTDALPFVQQVGYMQKPDVP